MGFGTIRIQGGDTAVTNDQGGGWTPEVQFTTKPTFLTKLVVFVPSAVSGNRIIWLFDTAAGDSSSHGPVTCLICPNGFTTTLDFGDYGKLFKNGLYIVVANNEPMDGGDNYSIAGNDALVAIDFKLK
jgi:hypothetical protein